MIKRAIGFFSPGIFLTRYALSRIVTSEPLGRRRALLEVADCRLLLINHTHFMSKSVMRLPFGTSHGSRFLKHLVDLLQRQPLGLGNNEKGKHEAQNESAAPDKEDLDCQITLILVHNVWGDDGNDTVPEPVRGRCKSDALGANGEWIDLADDDPRSRTPGGGKGSDVEASEYDQADIAV